MGQQQLLLIVLGVIIVGIAVILGIILFQQNSVDQKRDMLIDEGLTVANNAITFSKKAREFGGGQNSFIGWQIPPTLVNSPNGTFDATSISADEIILTGTGNDIVSGNNLVEVRFIVTRDSITTEIVH